MAAAMSGSVVGSIPAAKPAGIHKVSGWCSTTPGALNGVGAVGGTATTGCTVATGVGVAVIRFEPQQALNKTRGMKTDVAIKPRKRKREYCLSDIVIQRNTKNRARRRGTVVGHRRCAGHNPSI